MGNKETRMEAGRSYRVTMIARVENWTSKVAVKLERSGETGQILKIEMAVFSEDW